MERLQQLASHCLLPQFYGEQPDMENFDKFLGAYGLKLLFEQEEEGETRACSETNLSCLQDYSTMPFLQMLQSTEWEGMETQIMTMDFESCVTQETMGQQHHHQPQQPHYSTCCLDGLSPGACEQVEQAIESLGNSRGSTSPAVGTTSSDKDHLLPKSVVPLSREKRKRKRPKRPTKNEVEVQSQRMTHIAVERNRRRQMNEHLNTLRALMPPSYIQRGDQASIIGGAINFVKELEQLLESLQAQKRMKTVNIAKEEITEESNGVLTNEGCNCSEGLGSRSGGGLPVESSTSVAATAEIDVTVIQTHVNLRIQCEKRPGQLLKAIIALEDLRLTVLHLNITSSETLIHYSFNLKIEEDCKIGSADEIAGAVHQIFNFINGF